MRGRGRMLVTGATLIHSSSSSLKSTGSYDRLNASRDVTFPANLKELEPALFLSCLILFSRFYDKQTRTGWGQERERQRDRGRQGGGQVYAVRGTRCLCKLALCLFHKGLETQVQIKTWNLPSAFQDCKDSALNPINLRFQVIRSCLQMYSGQVKLFFTCCQHCRKLKSILVTKMNLLFLVIEETLSGESAHY